MPEFLISHDVFAFKASISGFAILRAWHKTQQPLNPGSVRNYENNTTPAPEHTKYVPKKITKMATFVSFGLFSVLSCRKIGWGILCVFRDSGGFGFVAGPHLWAPRDVMLAGQIFLLKLAQSCSH